MGNTRKGLFKAMFFFFITFFSFIPIKSASASTTDFSQSSISTGVGSPLSILSLIPDPDVSYSSIVSFMNLFPADGPSSTNSDSFAITNLIRRNTTSATFSDTLFVYIDPTSDGPPLSLIPVTSNSAYTLSFLSSQEGSGTSYFKFYATPTSDLIWPLGTTIGIKTIDLNAAPSITMSNQYFADNVGRGISSDGVPFIRFYTSVSSFPNVTGGMPASVLVSEVPAEGADPDTGDRLVAYYTATMTSGGVPSTPTPDPVTLINVGPPPSNSDPNNRSNAANEMPYLADLNKDNIQDLVILVNENQSDTKSYVLILLGNGDGTFGSFTAHEIDNKFIFGITSGDMDNDGTIDLVVSSFATPDAPSASEIDIIKNPLTSFEIQTLFSLNSDFSTFVHNLDCNVDGYPDIVSVEAEISIDSSKPNNNTTIQPGNVNCYLNNGKGAFSTSSNIVLYPKSLLQASATVDNGTQSLSSLILQSQVGDIGCGKGWFGSVFYDASGDNNNNNRDNNVPLGFNDVLFAQHSDCTAVIDALNGGSGSALQASGGGCSFTSHTVENNPALFLLMGTSLLATLFIRQKQKIKN